MVSPIAHNQNNERQYDDEMKNPNKIIQGKNYYAETFPKKTIHYINKSSTIYYKILYLDFTHR